MNIFSTLLSLSRAVLLATLALLGLAGCGGGGGGGAAAVTLTAIEITPLNSTAAAGTTRQFAAMAIYSNNTKNDVTASTTWTSSDTSIASINAAGLATAVRQGAVTITARFDGQTASTPFTVGTALVRSISVTPSAASLAKGSTLQYTATATFSDNSTSNVTTMATWASSSTAVATISNAAGTRGLATAVNTGTSIISATLQGVSGSTGLTVTAATLSRIDVTPSMPSIAKGTTQQFTATGVFTDSSTQNLTSTVTWSSSATTVASISNDAASKGLASGLGVGSSTISATAGTITGSTQLTVTAATLVSLQVTPSNASVAKGVTQQFSATGTYTDQSTQDLTASVVWASSAETVATVSNAAGSSGLASTLAEGTTRISAALNDISNAVDFTVTAAVLSRIEVTPSAPTIPAGVTQQFAATGVYTDGSTMDFTATATWASSDVTVLEVSNSDGQRGLAAAKVVGGATLSAATMGITGSTEVTVSNATLTAIQVTPPNRSLAKGFSLQYTATGTFSDNSTRDVTTQVTWASSNSAAATISNAEGSRGLATATTTPGSTNITASAGAVAGSTSLTVTNATLSSVAITPANRTNVPKGISAFYKATGTFSDSTTQDLSEQADWSSSNTAVITVSNAPGSKGFGTAVDRGTTTITAAVRNAAITGAVTGTTNTTVVDAGLTRIAVTPPTATAAKGTTQQFTATGTYTDNSTQDITASVTWTSSSTATATISNANANKGLATAVAVGTTSVSAALGSVSGMATFEVTAATLVSLDVTPKAATVAAGRSQQYAAVGTYTDGSTQTLTNSVTWSSDNTAVATISNADGSRGLASSTAQGTAQIKATSGTVESTAVPLTVSNAVPVSIAVTPAAQTIGNKTSLQFVATETFSDGSSSDQTAAVTWTSSNTTLVDISNAAGSKGLATAKAQGTVTITATDASVTPNITASTTLTVGPAALQSITVTGRPGALPAGFFTPFTATGRYADGTTQDLSTQVSWSTLNSAVATVSNAAGSQGRVTGVAVGSTTLLASLNGVTGNVTVAVSNATLASIDVTPKNAEIIGQDTLQYRAVGTFSDAGTLDITRQVTWASSTTTNVTIDQNGLATGTANPLPGDSTISASRGTPAVTGSTTVSHAAF